MTPKEKAEELADTIFKRTYHIKGEDAKQCALIAVDEILSHIYYESKMEYKYWQEVKNEIEKL